MTTAKKDEVQTKSPAAPAPKPDTSVPAPKDVKPQTGSAAPSASAPTAPVPPLTQAANARAALDEEIKAKIIEALKQPGASMTKIANEMGVSYSLVQGIKAKLNPATRAASGGGAVATKSKSEVEDVELMRLELDFLRKKVALLESRTK